MLAFALIVPKDIVQFAVGIPAIFNHFQHHNEEHAQISFVDFIKEHTANTDKNKHDHEHDNLPFNHHHSSDCSQTLTYIPFYSSVSLKFSIPLSVHVKVVEEQLFIGSGFYKNIWQPPKIS